MQYHDISQLHVICFETFHRLVSVPLGNLKSADTDTCDLSHNIPMWKSCKSADTDTC